MSTPISPEDNAFLIERIRKLTSPRQPIPTGMTPIIPIAKQIKAVMVDVYGTILITGNEPGLTSNTAHERQSLVDALKSIGFHPASVNASRTMSDLYRNIRTDHLEQRKTREIDFPEVDIIEIWKNLPTLQDIDPDLIPRLIVEFVTRVEQPWLMPGLDELLETLNDTDIALGIISNSQFYTPLTLEALSGKPVPEMGFDPDLCFYSYECKAAKPSHYLYTMAAEGLAKRGIAPSQVLYIGNDLLKDVHAAMLVGFNAALFAGDQQSLRLHEDNAAIRDHRPDAVFTHLTQAIQCLGIL